YTRIKDEVHPGEPLCALLRTDEIAQAVEAAINEHYLHDQSASTQEYTGNLLLVKDIVTRYLKEGLLPYDAQNDRFTVIGLEDRIACGFPFPTADGERTMQFAGVADRIDRLDDGTLRVVDYKTGAEHLDFKGIDSLFHGRGKDRQSNILQTLLYAMMLHRTRHVEAIPALFYMRGIQKSDYSPLLNDTELNERGVPYSRYSDTFEQFVRETLTEMYDAEIPFRQCEDADTCQYCDFKTICNRKKS
ncbi:MAG: PD-(D/E)XK nuclease family protein, partial [Alistipes sp.]|nr:PD-(D/E)XK nuclease family protein [Alistipes sp.]